MVQNDECQFFTPIVFLNLLSTLVLNPYAQDMSFSQVKFEIFFMGGLYSSLFHLQHSIYCTRWRGTIEGLVGKNNNIDSVIRGALYRDWAGTVTVSARQSAVGTWPGIYPRFMPQPARTWLGCGWGVTILRNEVPDQAPTIPGSRGVRVTIDKCIC